MIFTLISFKVLYGGELVTSVSPVSKKYMETYLNSNVASGSPKLEIVWKPGLIQCNVAGD